MSEREHWEAVYRTKGPDQVSWYQPHLRRSLEHIERAGLALDAVILDVGAGASTLVDDLLERGHTRLIVNDLSEGALAASKNRLGARANAVTWLPGDILHSDLPDQSVDFWHDRAVFHFLTDEGGRARYVAEVRRIIRPRGHVLIATFGPHGPERCSGLPVQRYDGAALHSTFGDGFTFVSSTLESHATPWGTTQEFLYCACRFDAPADIER